MSTRTVWYRAVGDNAPPMTGTLLVADGTVPAGLAGATCVVKFRAKGVSGAVGGGGVSSVLDPALGTFRYVWSNADKLLAAGDYEFNLVVTYADATVESFPNDSYNILHLVGAIT